MTFRAELHLARKTATGIEVPDEVVEALGTSRRPAVRATVTRVDPAGPPYEYRTTVAPMGGTFWIPVSNEHRAASGLHAGDIVDVDLVVDDEPRVIDVPADLHDALTGDAQAAAFYATLSPTRQRAFVDWVTSAKKLETRSQRVGQTVQLLREHRTAR